MLLQGTSTGNPQTASGGNPQTASGGPPQLRGPSAARDFAVPRAQVFPPQPFMLPCGWGENSSHVLWKAWCFGTVRMCEINGIGCYAILQCWVILTTSTDPEWPVTEDCCLSLPALCHPCVSGLPSPVLLPVCPLKKKKKVAEETCTTGYLMQILLKCSDTYIQFWLVVAVHE